MHQHSKSAQMRNLIYLRVSSGYLKLILFFSVKTLLALSTTNHFRIVHNYMIWDAPKVFCAMKKCDTIFLGFLVKQQCFAYHIKLLLIFPSVCIYYFWLSVWMPYHYLKFPFENICSRQRWHFKCINSIKYFHCWAAIRTIMSGADWG